MSDPLEGMVRELVRRQNELVLLEVEKGLGRMALAGPMRSHLHVWVYWDSPDPWSLDMELRHTSTLHVTTIFDPNEDVAPAVVYHPYGQEPPA